VPAKTKRGGGGMKKELVAKEWIKKTEKALERERREIEIDYMFRKEFGFSPDKIEWIDGGPVAIANANKEGVVFAVTEIVSGQTVDWNLREYGNVYNWEKKDGRYLYSVSILRKDGGIELCD
jgi:hypothetical protein